MLEEEYYDHLSNTIVDYIEADDHRFKLRMHYHNGYEVYFFARATAQLLVNHQVCEIRDGDVLLINPFIMHTAYQLAPGFYQRYYINMATGLVWQAMQRYGLDPALRLVNAPSCILIHTAGDLNRLMQARFGAIHRLYDQQPALWQEKLAGELALLLADIAEFNRASPVTETPQPNDSSFYRILAYIDDHLHEKIALEELEQRFFVTRFHICRMFRRETGLTFSQYVNRKKIIIAQQVLNNLSSSVTEACQASGFHHLQHFSKVFKEVTQMTPSAYQRLKRQEAADWGGEIGRAVEI